MRSDEVAGGNRRYHRVSDDVCCRVFPKVLVLILNASGLESTTYRNDPGAAITWCLPALDISFSALTWRTAICYETTKGSKVGKGGAIGSPCMLCSVSIKSIPDVWVFWLRTFMKTNNRFTRSACTVCISVLMLRCVLPGLYCRFWALWHLTGASDKTAFAVEAQA